MNNIKQINIGSEIESVVKQKNIDLERICKFFNLEEEDINAMYAAESLDTEILLKWCKLVKYDFFRVYLAHLQIFAPDATTTKISKPNSTTPEVSFKKKIYTPTIKKFILDSIENKTLTKLEAIDKYKIPKTTLYRWINKAKSQSSSQKKIEKKKNVETKKTNPNYDLIYRDIIETQENLDISVKGEMLDKTKSLKNSLSIIEMEERLVRSKITKTSIENQNLKAYDPESIRRILKYQIDNCLTNVQTAHVFKCSKNSIAKWKKLQKDDKLMQA